MERKTLVEWPTELPEGRYSYIMPSVPESADEPLTGSFRDDGGEIAFVDDNGVWWRYDNFFSDETFEPIEDPRDARIAALEGELSALRAQLAAPLRLGRGPTAEEFRRHNTTGGGWLLQGVGEDMGGWTMEMRPIPEADIPAMVRFTRDAIPLDASRQPCGVGVKL